MGTENFIVFAFTAFLFIITPGMDTIFVLNRTFSQGKTCGAYAALGVNAGVVVHTLLAALGLSILVSGSPYVFGIIKYMGAIYIIYLGIMQIRKKLNPEEESGYMPRKDSRKKNFISGFMTNALNPKVALFFLAFFPQFINQSQLENPVPFLVLGLTYTVIGIVWYLCLSFFAGTFSKKLQSNPKSIFWMNRISGFIFILMGAGIAFAGH